MFVNFSGIGVMTLNLIFSVLKYTAVYKTAFVNFTESSCKEYRK